MRKIILLLICALMVFSGCALPTASTRPYKAVLEDQQMKQTTHQKACQVINRMIKAGS